MAIPYLDTLIANINSRFSGEVVELVSASVFNPALLPDDELSTLANFYGKKAEVTFEGVTYSCCYMNKEELLGEWQVLRGLFSKRRRL